MPRVPRSPLRSAFLGLTVLAVLAFLCWQSARLLENTSIIPLDDFVEYWAAGRLNAAGENPYDGLPLLSLERKAGRELDDAVMMWNPPWTLSIAMPIGFLPVRHAQLLWLAISLVLVLVSADALWQLYDGPRSQRWIAWLLALTFVPTMFVLLAGQIGAFILLGIVGFMMAERKGLPWLAGACGVLMAIKPHLVYLFWIALAVWCVWRPLPRRWKIIAGGLIAGVIATAIPLISNSHVLGQYWEAMTHRTPELCKSPTIGSYLREGLGQDRFSLQFAPTLLGLAWLSLDGWLNRKRDWVWTERMPMLLLVSFVTASYGAWPFDLVILLPAVIHVGAGLASSRTSLRLLVAIVVYNILNAAALISNAMHLTSETFIWMSPGLLAAYIFLRPKPATT